MTYRVLWTKPAEGKLTRMWLDSRHRQSMTKVANHVESQLALNPLAVGESRNPGFRVTIEWPLGFAFFVDEPKLCVYVLDVWAL